VYGLESQYDLLLRDTWKPDNVFFVIFVARKHQQQFVFSFSEYKIDIGHECWGTDFNMNRLAIREMPTFTSSHIVYLDPKGKFIDRVNIFGGNSINISLRDDTIKCTDWVTNTIYSTMYTTFTPILQ
jgi:hypothetical protein